MIIGKRLSTETREHSRARCARGGELGKTGGVASGDTCGYASGDGSSNARRYPVVTEKSHETRLRRMAERQGLRLEKSRRRDPRALDYGRFMLLDARMNTVVGGAETGRHSWDLEDVEEFLTRSPDER